MLCDAKPVPQTPRADTIRTNGRNSHVACRIGRSNVKDGEETPRRSRRLRPRENDLCRRLRLGL
ncbi:MAG: hypothetical protein D6741_18050 [Planctomycetota bacterium]|nr:MAG: hypothetical protein D6741_18050 [Planctomycetota bacterium]